MVPVSMHHNATLFLNGYFATINFIDILCTEALIYLTFCFFNETDISSNLINGDGWFSLISLPRLENNILGDNYLLDWMTIHLGASCPPEYILFNLSCL